MEWLGRHVKGWLLLALAAVACVGTVGTAVLAGVALNGQSDSVDLTCTQVKKVRTDLVAVLVAARDISLREGRPSGYTDAQEYERQARVRAFYSPQLARIRPIRCP